MKRGALNTKAMPVPRERVGNNSGSHTGIHEYCPKVKNALMADGPIVLGPRHQPFPGVRIAGEIFDFGNVWPMCEAVRTMPRRAKRHRCPVPAHEFHPRHCAGRRQQLQFASLLKPLHIRHLVEYMNALSEWPRNRLLLALPSRDLRRLMPHLEHVPCRREQILVDADGPLDHVFFPDSGVVSVMAVYSDGGTIEMATIGREGCAGVQAVFGTSRSSARYWVQI